MSDFGLEPDARPPGAGSALRSVLMGLAVAAGLIGLWFGLVEAFALPHFILPSPARVLAALADQPAYLARHAAITASEIVLGLIAGTLLGTLTALAMTRFSVFRRLARPAVMASQAVPVFAIAPLLVIWFGYGVSSKVAMATLIIYFPLVSTLFDGLRRTEQGLLDIARITQAPPRRTLFLIRLPAALPSFASGLRVSASVAPIGAIVGEWVGSAAGLGFVMLQANARMQTDLVFAALLVLALMAVALRMAIDIATSRLVHWVDETTMT